VHAPSSPASLLDARPLVDALLTDAISQQASDIHIEPNADGCEVRFRIDGLLQTVQHLDTAAGRAVVTRLMVMAKLLTYRLDVPQEGRISFTAQSFSNSPSSAAPAMDLRLAVMPTLHGLRAAVRMPAEQTSPAELGDLGLGERVLTALQNFANSASGMLILTGPAGSGKTTTIYALLRRIARDCPGVSIIALEDPVERDLPGITQIEVSPFGQLTYERALRSILRQDPQVLMLGEVRDAATASLAIQAALSGHRLITTLHAAAPSGAIARLIEMGIEPYQITSSLAGIVNQRLARRRTSERNYRGRLPIAEWAAVDSPLKKAILARADADELAAVYTRQTGYQSLSQAAETLIQQGITDAAEIIRVLPQSAAGNL